MVYSQNTSQVHVFLSYRRIDNPQQGAYDGRVTMFRDALRAEISTVIGAGNTMVFMDTDPETIIGDKTWQDKILKQLAATTVFVSIMTANYLETSDSHVCSWEFTEYVKLYDADPARHSMIGIQLCDPDISKPILASGVWSSLGRQEIVDYATCRDAWREGPGHASWGKLVGKVADAIIAFTKNAPPRTISPHPAQIAPSLQASVFPDTPFLFVPTISSTPNAVMAAQEVSSKQSRLTSRTWASIGTIVLVIAALIALLVWRPWAATVQLQPPAPVPSTGDVKAHTNFTPIVGGGTGNDNFYSVAESLDGSIIAAGDTSSADGSFAPSKGGRDALLVKYGADGVRQWMQTGGGSKDDWFNSVAVAGDGSVIAAGGTASSDGSFPPTKGYENALLVKYDADGTLQWARTGGGSLGDWFNAVAVAEDGSVVAAGVRGSLDGDFPRSRGDGDTLLVKYSPDGTLLWAKTAGGYLLDWFSGVTVARDGSVIAVGYTMSSDGDLPPTRGNFDAVMVKFSSDGVLQWAKTLGGSRADGFNSVAISGDGNIVAVGVTASTDGSFPPSRGGANALVAKYSADGALLWVKTAGGSRGNSFNAIKAAGDGGAIIAGFTASTDGDLPPSRGGNDALIAKYSADGALLWAKSVGGTQDDAFSGVFVTADGSIVAAGATTSTDGDFPPSRGGQDTLLANFSTDGILR